MNDEYNYDWEEFENWDEDECENSTRHLPITEQFRLFKEECEKDKEDEMEFYRLNPNRV